MTAKCQYDRAWMGSCGAAVDVGAEYCASHLEARCRSCGSQAARECSYTGQFVCGTPLCKACEGFSDTSKSSGSWGFMNHFHARMDARGKPILRRKCETVGSAKA